MLGLDQNRVGERAVAVAFEELETQRIQGIYWIGRLMKKMAFL